MANETMLTIVGNITNDLELKHTQEGKSVVGFSIASTPRQYNRQSGQWEDGHPLFLRCTAWRELADHCAQSLSKGMRVIVQGRLQQRSYQAQDGSNRTVIELQVDEIGPSLRYATAQVSRVQQSNGFQGGNGFQGAQPQGGYPQGMSPQGGYQPPQQPVQQQMQSDPWAQSSQGFQQFQQTNDFGGGGDEPEF